MLAKIALVLSAYLLWKLAVSIVEWCRVQYIFKRNLPRGPPVKNLFLGNLLDCTIKDFHRTHQQYADLYGGFVPYRVLWIHVSTYHKTPLRVACMASNGHLLGLDAGFVFTMHACNMLPVSRTTASDQMHWTDPLAGNQHLGSLPHRRNPSVKRL